MTTRHRILIACFAWALTGIAVGPSAFGPVAFGQATKPVKAPKPDKSLPAPEVVRQRMVEFSAHLPRRAEALAIGAVHLPDQPIPAFSRFEAAFEVDATYDNPYDPAQIDVQAEITRPDGATVRIPAFYHVPYTSDTGYTFMDLARAYTQAGAPSWRVRYAPPAVGEYGLKLIARDSAGGQVEKGGFSFHAVESDRLGFVQVAAGNPNHFENSADGSLFWAVGTNIAYTRDNELGREQTDPPPSYELYFSRARGKMTATRVWLCNWSWLEWTPQLDHLDWRGYAGAGYYNQMVASALDNVFALAEAQGLRIMLVTDDNNELMSGEAMGEWAAHPYNRRMGGPCDGPRDIFSNPEAMRLYRNRLRYIIARWGYSDSLWAINAWNDQNTARPDEKAWISHMHAYAHSLFDGWRPIIYGTNYRFDAADLVDYRISDAALTPGKPNIIQECFYTPVLDQFRAELHEQLWKGFARGLAGVMCWNHRLVFQSDAWDEFDALRRFVEDLPLNKGQWQPLQVQVAASAPAAAGQQQRIVALRSYGDVGRWGARATRNDYPIDLSTTHQWLEGFAPKLYAQRADRPDWRNPPVFRIDMPVAGKMLIEVADIGGSDNTLIASTRTDSAQPWTEALRREWTGGRRRLKDAERWVEVPLAAGPQQVMLDAAGDWVGVVRIFIIHPTAGADALVEASGWTDGRQAFVYLANQTHSRLAQEILDQPPVDIAGASLRLAGLADGAYEVRIVSTDDGQVQSTATLTSRDGVLAIDVPNLQRDLALKLRPAP